LANTKKDKPVVLNEEVPASMEKLLGEFTPAVREDTPAPIKVEPSVYKPRLVKVMGLRKYNSSFGKLWFYVEKDKTLLVPDFVAEEWLKDTKNPKIKVVI
jgi:hypothetical protein